MMYSDFERDFMRRTLELVRGYGGPFDATFLLNCLLGLLVVPAESSLNAIPEDDVEALNKWGISPSCVKSFGRFRSPGPVRESVDAPRTLRRMVKALRNSVAHFRIVPIHEADQVFGFRFSDESGFRAEIPLAELREFVERLSAHLDREFQSEVR